MKNLLHSKFNMYVFSITFALIFLVVVLAFVGIATAVDDYAEAERGYRGLRRYSPSDPHLFSVNSDYAGWIYIEGTRISYPVVQADNTTYINTTFWGTHHNTGTLFIDSRNPLQFHGTFAMIHGYNSRTGTMFGTLDLYSSSEFMETHRDITIYTDDGEELTYSIFAAFATTVNSQLYTMFDADSNFIVEYFTANGAPAGSTHFLVLSTGTASDSDDDRTVVFAAR